MAGIVALDPRLHSIVDPNATYEKIADGFIFTEGPVWHSREKHLTFSDIQGNTLYRWTEGNGHEVFRRPSGEANGNSYDRQGRLLTCEHKGRRVSRTAADGSVETLASHFEGGQLNSPNDVVCASNGDLYFTDPPYGLRQPDGSFAAQDLDFCGVFRLSPDGALTLLVSDFIRPNGLVLSADEKRMFIADTQEHHVRVFDVTPDGLSGGEVFCDVSHEGAIGRPDGMKLDQQGNLYVTGNTDHGVWVYDPQGTLLGFIGVGEPPTNCAFGDDDWKTLYVTARTSVYRVRLKVPGMPVVIEG
jgi:sugar lactone lactonase YvrE